ncbi:MAG: phosphopentomutase/phosphoglucosamine mutase [Desulfurococcales archaeon]|nr:phosphopentomutase/phosphoglucosamine mutase [Desulfurococcales archaeon]
MQGRRLFGTAGVRGPYLDKVTPELAYRIGLAVAYYVGGEGNAAMAHDTRTTSPLLAQVAAAGMMAGGLNAIFLGLAPTPVLAFSVPYTESKAGIMITASHNPPPDNGIKLFDSSGMEYTVPMEKDIEDLVFNGDTRRMHATWDRVGRLTLGQEVIEEYKRKLVDMLHVKKPKIKLAVAVDCANGASSGVTPEVIRKIGVPKVMSLNCHPDGLFPGRYPEPRKDVVEPIARYAGELGAHILFAHDGDADRLAAAIPGLGFIKQDLLIALFSWWKLRDRRGTIIISVDVGNEVEDIVERMGGRIVRAKLGKLHERLKETPGALLAAEPWKLIDPQWGPWVDGIYQAALLVRISLEEGETPERLIRRLPFYPSARISFKLRNDDDKDKVYPFIEEEVKTTLTKNAVKILTIDGIRIDYDDRSWILLRTSGTEPKIRLYAQGSSRERLMELIEAAKGIVKKNADRVGVRIIGVEEHLDVDPLGR